MATTAQITSLRILMNDVDGAEYEDEVLAAAIDAAGSIKGAASDLWMALAAKYAKLVDVAESGSSRKLGDLHQNALRMAAAFDADDDEDTAVATGVRIRRLQRT